MSQEHWIEELHAAKITLLRLRGSIGGNSPSQTVMAEKLTAVIQILETQMTIEKQLRVVK
jgi:hypothetical protein